MSDYWDRHLAVVTIATLIIGALVWFAYVPRTTTDYTACEPSAATAMCRGNINPRAVLNSSRVTYTEPTTTIEGN